MKKGTLFLATLLVSLSVFAQTALTDTEITKVVLTINEGEIDAAKIAHKKSTREDVKDFANSMMKAHKDNKKETAKLAKTEKLNPTKSELSKSLESDAKASNKELKKNEKASLDLAYITQQISMHEKALNTFDTELIPQAKNAALKAHLEKTREAVAAHLAHAKEIRAKF